jgi:hypothetical protein
MNKMCSTAVLEKLAAKAGEFLRVMCQNGSIVLNNTVDNIGRVL